MVSGAAGITGIGVAGLSAIPPLKRRLPRFSAGLRGAGLIGAGLGGVGLLAAGAMVGGAWHNDEEVDFLKASPAEKSRRLREMQMEANDKLDELRRERTRDGHHYAFSPGKMKWLESLRPLATKTNAAMIGLGGGAGVAASLSNPPDQREQLEISTMPRNMQEAMQHPLIRELIAKAKARPEVQDAVSKLSTSADLLKTATGSMAVATPASSTMLSGYALITPERVSTKRVSAPLPSPLPHSKLGRVGTVGRTLKSIAGKRVSLGAVGAALIGKSLVVDPLVDKWAMKRAQHSMVE